MAWHHTLVSSGDAASSEGEREDQHQASSSDLHVPTCRFLKTTSKRERHKTAASVIQLWGQFSNRRQVMDSLREQSEETPEDQDSLSWSPSQGRQKSGLSFNKHFLT